MRKRFTVFMVLIGLSLPIVAQNSGSVELRLSSEVKSAIEVINSRRLIKAIETEKNLGFLTDAALKEYINLAQKKYDVLQTKLKSKQHLLRITLVMAIPATVLYAALGGVFIKKPLEFQIGLGITYLYEPSISGKALGAMVGLMNFGGLVIYLKAAVIRLQSKSQKAKENIFFLQRLAEKSAQ